MSELCYLGYPYSVWQDLQDKAEDLLYEEEIGQHILGLYPFGGRLFGLEIAPPEVLCLYMDSPINLLDPFIINKRTTRITTSHSGAAILFVDFHKWVSSFQTNEIELIKLVPLFEDSWYEDESIMEIINLIRDFVIHKCLQSNIQIVSKLDNLYHYELLLLHRALANFKLAVENSQEPWLRLLANPLWGDIDKYINFDNDFMETIFTNKTIPSISDFYTFREKYNKIICSNILKQKEEIEGEKKAALILKDISNKVIDLYQLMT